MTIRKKRLPSAEATRFCCPTWPPILAVDASITTANETRRHRCFAARIPWRDGCANPCPELNSKTEEAQYDDCHHHQSASS